MLITSVGLLMADAPVAPGQESGKEYIADVEVVRGPSARAAGGTGAGVVFNDRNRDGRRQRREGGIADVAVSNGREVVRTDSSGSYELPA